MSWFIRDEHGKGWSFAWVYWEDRSGDVELVCAARIRMTKTRDQVRAQALYPQAVRGRWGPPRTEIDGALAALGDELR